MTPSTCMHACRMVNAIHREEAMGHPLKKMVRDLDIPPERLNVSIFDDPVLPNRVLRAAREFRTPTDHEAGTPLPPPHNTCALTVGLP